MTDAMHSDDSIQSCARETLMTGLRNAHSMEQQAISVLNMQLGRLDDYPELRSRLQDHVGESERQAERLDRMLQRFDTSTSSFKDTVMSLMGSAQSSMQAMADDAVLKAMMADTMFEHFEITAYRSLIELSDLAGMGELKPELETSLREEEEMARWLEERLPEITRRYVELTAGVEPAAPGTTGAGTVGAGAGMSGAGAGYDAGASAGVGTDAGISGDYDSTLAGGTGGGLSTDDLSGTGGRRGDDI
jgi:ferritin-like metal-binding protein YciE